jgi:hypothetical protein
LAPEFLRALTLYQSAAMTSEEPKEYIGPDGQPMSKSAWKKYQTQLKNQEAKDKKAAAKSEAAPKAKKGER